MTYLPPGSGIGGGGGGAPGIGALLFAWNKADLAQFDTGTQLRFRNTLGTAPLGTMAPSFVANAFQGRPGIRLTTNALNHGIVLPVLASELALPSHFFMFAHVRAMSVASLIACLCPFGMDDAGDWRGAVHRRDQGAAVSQPRITTDQAGNQTLRALGIVSATPAADTWNAALEQRGGVVFEIECWRQDGDNPTDWAYRVRSQEASSYDAGALSRQDCTSFADPSPDWDGVDMTRLGIGVCVDTGGAVSGDVDFLDLQVFEAA